MGQSVSQEAVEWSRTIAEKKPHLAWAPGELHNSSTNTPPMDACVWSSSSATGGGNYLVSPISVIKV